MARVMPYYNRARSYTWVIPNTGNLCSDSLLPRRTDIRNTNTGGNR